MAEQGETKTAETSTPPVAAAGATKQAPAKKSAKEEAPASPDVFRRRIIWTMIWGYLGVCLLMFLRFFFPRALFEPNTVFNIGYPNDFALGVDTKFQRQYRIAVVKEPDKIFVIFVKCTHLGCTPDWRANENKFKCPCHGSGYDSEGVNFEGPAPRPMDRAHVELDPTGQITVDTSRLYVDDPRAGTNHFGDAGAFLNV